MARRPVGRKGWQYNHSPGVVSGVGRRCGFDDDGDAGPHVLRFGRDGDAETAAAIHGIVGIGDEIHKDLFAELGVDLDIRCRWSVVTLHRHLSIWMLMLDRFENVIDNGRQLHGTKLEARGTSEVEESGDE